MPVTQLLNVDRLTDWVTRWLETVWQMKRQANRLIDWWTKWPLGQCPLLAPSVHGPQMVCVCVCVCVCVDGMNLKYALRWHIHISVHSVLCQCYTQAHAHTHPQTIWGWRTDGAKSGHCHHLYTLENGCTKRAVWCCCSVLPRVKRRGPGGLCQGGGGGRAHEWRATSDVQAAGEPPTSCAARRQPAKCE